jgi:23S rRNA (guanosine2251-2'-O)-methyltransferase
MQQENFITTTIKGRNPVLEALRSGRPIGKILLAKNVERHSAIAQILHLAKSKNIPVEFVDRRAIDKQSESAASQGVIALTTVREYIDLDELMAIPKARNEIPFYVILDGVEDPYNLGAVLRTADATGVHGVIIREKRAVGLTAGVEKASSGAVEYVPVARVTNISQAIETLKRENIWIVGVDRGGTTPYSSVDYKPPTAIVIGGEGKGLTDLVKKKCDFLAFIPMKGKITSLNASVAAGVVMYEVLKQRTLIH